MKAIIPSYQWFFTPGSFKLGSFECWIILVCKISRISQNVSDECSTTQENDSTKIVSVIEKCSLVGEIAVLEIANPLKATVLVKLPCGSSKSPFKQGSKCSFTGRLELWAKPEITLNPDLKTTINATSIGKEDENGECEIDFDC
ncbi:MAG: hypothetical protein HGA95_01360 [Caldiserica bacterium]|nr:hypothetical protein [Caldisericota bacterium]